MLHGKINCLVTFDAIEIVEKENKMRKISDRGLERSWSVNIEVRGRRIECNVSNPNADKTTT